MRSNTRGNLSVVLTLLFLVAVVALGFVNARFAAESYSGGDFLPRWVGANYWLVEGINPYDPQVSQAAQELIYGRRADPKRGEDPAHFIYPLPAMLFFAPFGLMSLITARAIWITLLQICLPVIAYIGVQLAGWKVSRKLMVFLMVFSVAWYHGFRSMIFGQFAILEAVLISGALLAVHRRQDNLAGLLFGLSIAKPQMSILLILFVLTWAVRSRRWELVRWTIGSMSLLIGLSIALIPNWLILWLRQIVDYSRYFEIAPPISVLGRAIPIASNQVTIGLVILAVLYLLWEWIAALGGTDRRFQWTAAMTIVLNNLICVFTVTENYVILLPVLCLILGVFSDRWRRPGVALAWIILISLILGLWGLFQLTAEGNMENPIMFFPMPILCLFGLWWSRWWATSIATFQMQSMRRS